MKKRNVLILLVLIVVLPAATVFFYRHYQAYKEDRRERLVFEKRRVAWSELRRKLTDEIVDFKGEAGIVIKDLKMSWELSFNRDKLFPSASLVKVPIMAACFLADEEGKLGLDRKIKLKPGEKFSGSGILKTTYPDTEFSVERLVGLMIYESDNTATNILTDMLGFDYLNDSFKKFGLKDTVLSRKIADYRSRSKGIENYTTARDMALILERIYQRSLINKDISEKCIEILKLQRINDRIPKYLPVDIVIAHKTGLERGVCHDAGIVFSGKGDFVICVLTRHAGPSSDPAKEFIAKVSLHTYNYFEQAQ